MKSNTKSSVTLPPAELAVVERLRSRLGAKTKVEVIRRALRLLENATDRDQLARDFAEASRRTRAATLSELSELDHLAGEGMDE